MQKNASLASFPDVPADQIDSYVTVVELVRSGAATTRPEIGRKSGLGRSIVSERIDQAMARGLIAESDLGPSTGGRAPRRLRFVAERGYILVASFGALGVGAAVTDLSGDLINSFHGPWNIEDGPEQSLDHLLGLFDGLLSGLSEREIWGIAIGLPGPVEYATGQPVLPPIMPGWDGFDIRGWFAKHYNAPVWVDNDVNLMALGQLVWSDLPPESDLLFVKVGSGVGAGLISAGRIHRGANGGAGDVGHVAVAEFADVPCRCGQRGCLEAVAGGWALARDGAIEAAEGRSPYLSKKAEANGIIRPIDIAEGARNGDPASLELIARSGRLIGENISGMVSFFNPALVAVGGAVATSGDLFLATVRHAVYARSLPLATRDLKIVPSSDDPNVGLRGGAYLVIDELFERGNLRRWLAKGSPLVDRDAIYARVA